MSKLKKVEKGQRTRYQVSKINQGEFIGKKFVKKANMTIKFKNFNKVGKPDIQEWE